MGILENKFPESVLFTTVDDVINASREYSLWYMLFATACCGIELMQFGASRYDVDRLGMVPRASPRQSDLMIIAGTITHKMASRVKRLYEQMPNPKYVIAMGSCSSSGGPFSKFSYSVLNGIDKYIPVDVYVPGCPPRPEALIKGVMMLREKMRGERTLVRNRPDPERLDAAPLPIGHVDPPMAVPANKMKKP